MWASLHRLFLYQGGMNNMSNNTNKDLTQLHIHAADHPKAYAPHILILNIVMSILGAIIGLELIVRTGVAPNTSIVGALFAIIISRIPIAILKKYQSIHCQNLIQTSISGANFCSQLFPASDRCTGDHGETGIDVSDADRFFPGNGH